MMNDERTYLRELAARVRDIAALPEMETRRQRWKRHNALQGDRPMVLCFPEGGWSELLPESSLRCTQPFHREIEQQLRMKIYHWEHLRDDNTIEPWLNVGWSVHIGDYGVEIPRTHGDDRGSYVWEAPIKDLTRDLDKLHHRELSVDRQKTHDRIQRANELVGDLLPVRIHGGLWWTLGLTQTAAYLIGLENLMWAMYDAPNELHRLMAFLRDDTMNFINWCERENLLTSNTGGADYVGSGGVGTIDGIGPTDGPVKLHERWGFGESQETVGVSPAMFEEFILAYQKPLLEKFPLNCYGCCEGLEHRFDKIAAQIPGLRRVSVAPMANEDVLARKLAGKYVYSRKPNPAPVCVGFDERAIREDLRHTLQLAGEQPLEFVMKDTHTVEHHPERLTRWVQIAYEEIDRYLSTDRRPS
jgi:hypothetical protein